ncbi:hypothetical protein INT43_000460 [Umbelopsis isabellina]|uniref:Probable glutamate--tRNA ligase, cytoplasmic n=1 Tax=Mortierella isabellina TaxID=91625 RepID=A0A8H7UG61_MORIS|nr:hypothetical protein INT43_000460 [Umbelopsis isabellina]
MDDLIPLFVKVGLTEQKAKDTVKNKKLAPTFERVINEAGGADGCSKETGNLLYFLASKITKDAEPHLPFLAKKIASGDLKSTEQVSAAISFVEEKPEPIDEASFNEETGVGITVTSEQIDEAISKYIEQNKDNITENRYRTLGPSLAATKKLSELRWADGAAVKNQLEAQYLALLGPKDERDAPQKKKKEPKAVAPKVLADQAAKTDDPAAAANKMFFEGEISNLHKPGGNKQINPELMKKHLEATGKKVVTRFPPEPNGYLHIGHAKAINVNFGYAKAHNGITYLRYDDTNPEAEEEKYFSSILDTVKWLGFEPYKITHSSDYFQDLYELAIKLIKKGLAYTCQCTGEEIAAHRGGESRGPRTACVHRDRSVEETLEQFQMMKDGRYKEGETTLRMKMNLEDGNPQFWDLIAYRILYTPHHRTGSQWCIYPTYDFTHCLVDSLENITHSLCTLEFRQSRESYYWLCDAVEVYKPVQWEYARLNVTNTVMSKRKILKMVNEKYVNGWDDPRLFTLVGIRRRGVPPEAINNFVAELGISMYNAQTDVIRLDNHTRDYLDRTAPRLMAILEPVKVVLENLPSDYLEMVTVPNKPRDPSMGEHTVPFTNTLYIDAADFREQDSPDYYRLAPGKTVGLLHTKAPITCTDVIKDANGKIVELRCRFENGEGVKKPKTYIHWVAESPQHGSPVKLDDVRLYEILFNHANPSDKTLVPGGYLSDINENSISTVTGAISEVGIYDHLQDWIKKTGGKDLESARWQFVRNGYFCLDLDTELDIEAAKNGNVKTAAKKLVFNRTVTLKEDSSKDDAVVRKGGIVDTRKRRA